MFITPVEYPHMNIPGVAVRMSFLASVEQEIYHGVSTCLLHEIYHAFKCFIVFINNFRF